MGKPAATARPCLRSLSYSFTLDVGVFGGSDAAALWCLVASGLGQTGGDSLAVGTPARLVLSLCPGVHAATARSPLVRREEARPHLCGGFLLIARSIPPA